MKILTLEGLTSLVSNIKKLINTSAENTLVNSKKYTDEKVTTLNTSIGSKANTTALESHTSNTTSHITSTERTNWNRANTHASSTHAPVDAEVNQNAFSNITIGSTTISADSKTDTLTLVGSNVTLTPDTTNDKVTIGITKDNVTTALGYTPPTTNTTYGVATSNALGLVKSGTDITVDSSGNVSVNDNSHKHTVSNISDLTATASEINIMDGVTATTAEINYLDGVTSSIQSQLDTITSNLTSHSGNTTSHVTSTERTNWGSAYTHSTSTHAPSNAEANQNAFSNIKVGSTTVAADSQTDTLELAGSNITITPDATNDKITFAVADGTTSAKGIVQLTNSTSSTSTTTAATPNSVKSAYDLANTAKTNAATAQSTADSKVGSVSLSSGTNNGTLKLTVNGTATDNIAVKGLGSAAYTASTAYATSSHNHTVSNITDLTATATELNYCDGVTSNIQTQLNGKAASSHGNHVPTTETANNAKFLRNDNTWQTVTPANIGAAASSHGTHVSYSTTVPVMDGTASVGTASTVSRSDHVHPTDTSRASASHTHNYAGSSSAGGAATTALTCTGNSATATDSDTVDGCHAWNMQTLDATGNPHGASGWLVKVQHNIDNDGYFKIVCGDGSAGIKVDMANASNYASNAMTANSMSGWIDNRNVNTVPNDYNGKFEVKGLKANTAIGNPDFSSYSTIMGVRAWHDNTGGDSHEIAFTGNGQMFQRHGSTDTWNSWNRFYTSENITYGTSSLTAGSSYLATGNIYLQYE